MSLHRKTSLITTFKDTQQRQQATRVFWCIYVLDRRWSFGVSLPFTIADRDIDPDLPEPVCTPCYNTVDVAQFLPSCVTRERHLTRVTNQQQDSQDEYLRCTIRYGKLCSSLWDALYSHGDCSNGKLSNKTADLLASKTQAWLSSIPQHLRFRHPAARHPGYTYASSLPFTDTATIATPDLQPPRFLQRLRALLYLRANHTQLLIYRHHLTSPAAMRASNGKAALAVAVAKDTIGVLAHLHATTDIYTRQQNGWNYFLVAAIAAIFLAVCHDPETFADECHARFSTAVELVRDVSQFGTASRRLWRSVRGLLPRLRRVGMSRVVIEAGEDGEGAVEMVQDDENQGERQLEEIVGVASLPGIRDLERGPHSQREPLMTVATLACDDPPQHQQQQVPLLASLTASSMSTNLLPDYNFGVGPGLRPNNEWMPDMLDISNELMELFQIFGEGQQLLPAPVGDTTDNVAAQVMSHDPTLLTSEEISRQFQDLM